MLGIRHECRTLFDEVEKKIFNSLEKKKIDELKHKHGPNVIVKVRNGWFNDVMISKSNSDIIILDDFLIEFHESRSSLKKSTKIINGKVKKMFIFRRIDIDSRLIEGKDFGLRIFIYDCPNLKKIYDRFGNVCRIFIENCPLIEEIDIRKGSYISVDRYESEVINDDEEKNQKLLTDIKKEFQELKKEINEFKISQEQKDNHYPAMVELLRQRIEKLEKK